jgi:hypothetical protein
MFEDSFGWIVAKRQLRSVTSRLNNSMSNRLDFSAATPLPNPNDFAFCHAEAHQKRPRSSRGGCSDGYLHSVFGFCQDWTSLPLLKRPLYELKVKESNDLRHKYICGSGESAKLV